MLLGATSQIGKELCLYIKENKNIDLICHAELEFQLLFLNLNINCVVCDLEDEALIKEIKSRCYI